MAHAQKPDFVFRCNGRVHVNRKLAGASVQSTTGSQVVRISGNNAGYTMFRGSVKSTGYPLHSPVSPSLALPASLYAITFQLESNIHLRTPLVRNVKINPCENRLTEELWGFLERFVQNSDCYTSFGVSYFIRK